MEPGNQEGSLSEEVWELYVSYFPPSPPIEPSQPPPSPTAVPSQPPTSLLAEPSKPPPLPTTEPSKPLPLPTTEASQPPQRREELLHMVPLLTLVGNDQQEFDLEQQMLLNEQLLQEPQNSLQENKRLQHKKERKDERIATYEVPESNVWNIDEWTWKKYYEKPMMSPPYRRSHVDCPAKKVVERSTSNDKVFNVSYYGVHMHNNGQRTITFVGAEEMGFAPNFNGGPSHAEGTGTSERLAD